MKKTIRDLAIKFAPLAIGGVAWIWLASRQLDALAPPSENVDFCTFADEMPPPQRLAIIEGADSSIRIVWVGELASMSLPSGPSCYVFDESGTLVRWSTSTGDGELTTHDGMDAYSAEIVTNDDVRVAINAG